ncbi:MAG: Fur family transcriptional regulator [Halothermotrichaceae bacterium]
MNKLDYWQEKLKEKGIRNTEQRTAIMQVLIDNKIPMTAGDIFDKLKKEMPRLRLSTVYRNLNGFEENDIIRKIEINIEKKENYFELLDGKHHHHLICEKCGEILPVACPLKEYMDKISQETDYTISDHKIKIYGCCPRCSEKI